VPKFYRELALFAKFLEKDVLKIGRIWKSAMERKN
jgi:hypothetical protein